MHNMIVEDQRDDGHQDGHSHLFQPENQPEGVPEWTVTRPPKEQRPVTIAGVIAVSNRLHDSRAYNRLRADIIENLWMLHGDV